MLYCIYYQARVEKAQTWYVAAILRSFDHLVFDRTINKELGIIEYYMPVEFEDYFVQVMNFFIAEGIVHDLTRLPNRLEDPTQEV